MAQEMELEQVTEWFKTLGPEDIRPQDLEELCDSLTDMGFSISEIEAHFPTLLEFATGVSRPEATFSGILADDQMCFLMCAFLPKENGPWLLTGFGSRDVDCLVHFQHRMPLITDGFSKLIDYVRNNGGNTMLCHVKKSNIDTLMMWRVLRVTFRDLAKISIIDNPWREGYNMVTVDLPNREGGL